MMELKRPRVLRISAQQTLPPGLGDKDLLHFSPPPRHCFALALRATKTWS